MKRGLPAAIAVEIAGVEAEVEAGVPTMVAEAVAGAAEEEAVVGMAEAAEGTEPWVERLR